MAAATRWEPRRVWSEMNRLRDEVDRLLGRLSGEGPRTLSHSLYPPINLWEDNEKLFVEAELPGFDLQALEVTIVGDTQLSIKGQQNPPEREGGTWHLQERGYGTFHRTVELPSHVDPDQIAAEFNQGILYITMTKREGAKARRIDVQSGQLPDGP